MNEIHRCGNTWMYCDGDCANCTLNSVDANQIKNGTIGDGVVVLEEQPTIDVVPVVRCKDCKHNYSKKHNKSYNHEDIVCDYFETDGLNDDDFCSYGERSEDGEA